MMYKGLHGYNDYSKGVNHGAVYLGDDDLIYRILKELYNKVIDNPEEKIAAVNNAATVEEMQEALNGSYWGLDVSEFEGLNDEHKAVVAQALISNRPEGGYADKAAIQAVLDAAVLAAGENTKIIYTKPGIGSTYNEFYWTYNAGESFIARGSTITEVSVWLTQACDTDIKAEILSGSYNDGEVIGSAIIRAYGTGKLTGYFTNPVIVTTGTKYFLKLSAPEASTGMADQQTKDDNPDTVGYWQGGTSSADMAMELVYNGNIPDFTSPAAPTDLSAVAKSFSEIELAWNATADGNAVGYKIYRDGRFIAITDGTVYTDSSLVSGTEYEYSVAAYDNIWNVSEKSNTATVTTQSHGVNIALGKPASADSQEAENPASYGNDGIAQTRWGASDSAPPHSWQVDLQGNFSLAGIEILWEGFSPVYKFKVEVSGNNADWTVSLDKTDIVLTEKNQYFDLDNAGNVRYVRVTVTGPDDTWASFYECSLFGVTV